MVAEDGYEVSRGGGVGGWGKEVAGRGKSLKIACLRGSAEGAASGTAVELEGVRSLKGFREQE